jgi:hypothetical protein
LEPILHKKYNIRAGLRDELNSSNHFLRKIRASISQRTPTPTLRTCNLPFTSLPSSINLHRHTRTRSALLEFVICPRDYLPYYLRALSVLENTAGIRVFHIFQLKIEIHVGFLGIESS